MSDELDPALRSLLDASKAADALPDPTRARVWARVETSLAAPVITPTSWSSWVTPTVVAFALAAGVSALWFGASAMREAPRVVDGAAAYGRGDAGTIERRAAVIESDVSPTPPVVAPAEIPVADTEPVAPEPIEAARPIRKRSDAPRPSDEETTDDVAKPNPLVDELARLREAQSMLRKDPQRTLTLLDALDRDHPKGAMIPERAALRVFAACGAGDETRARTLAAKFAGRYATSPLLERVRTTCAAEKSPEP